MTDADRLRIAGVAKDLPLEQQDTLLENLNLWLYSLQVELLKWAGVENAAEVQLSLQKGVTWLLGLAGVKAEVYTPPTPPTPETLEGGDAEVAFRPWLYRTRRSQGDLEAL
jgi:hypothetical protein